MNNETKNKENYINNNDNIYSNSMSTLYIKLCTKETQDYLKCLDSHAIENKSKCKEYLKKFIECNDSVIYKKN